MMTSSNTIEDLVIQGKSYNVECVLGKGAFGEVLKVRSSAGSGSVYALKKILIENQEAVDLVKKEINVLVKCITHDHIVKIYGFDVRKTSKSQFVLILLEYCEGGNLNSRLAKPSGEETNLRWMTELTDAICYLHSKKIAHRDLKPENVLLTARDSIKLGDFGLAREFAVLKQPNATRSDQALLSYMTTVYMKTQLGTPSWMAPEVFKGHYTEKADIFSLGSIFYAILERKYLWVSGKRYFGAFIDFHGQKMGLGEAMTKDRSRKLNLDGQSRPKQELVRGMLDYDPKKRPSAENVLEDLKKIRCCVRLTDRGGGESSSGGGCFC